MNRLRHVWRVILLAGLLAAVFELQATAMDDIAWLRVSNQHSWQHAVTRVQLVPDVLLRLPAMVVPISLAGATAVTIAGVAYALVGYLAWRALDRAWRGPRLSGVKWRASMTMAIVVVVVVIGSWIAHLRVRSLQEFERCRTVIGQIPPGATRADVRVAIRDARPAFGEIGDKDVFDPAAQVIDVGCSDPYGGRDAVMDVHVDGDQVVRVDCIWRTRGHSDMVRWVECSDG